ncbi:MAG: exodeoxyribonuclease III [Alphaproteobacteria bacterium]|jgi:exodeoxyribonuclease III|nr:exodeoxyribonuclease III [Alphaproteobacteria bacterium]MBU2041904.1 exodeoxyribonuclease III [Alphaproteobacteria bacterium]MBU2125767.1 exodeoxyribonuclease III [Alphaproteobacteria bacterium]MBU2207943.1 exodeoxyribonuclease III [Alphaproteobacteria bacterium]MBU2291584.1 exodeoxyribonuclease III [Alphaproteobacteria bacterium]
MRIATWNVNSVNARLPTVLAWLEAAQPDVVGFQEIKCLDEKFPREAFESLGYNVETNGQKTYNGVALLSKYPLSDVRRGLPGADASGFEAGFEQARYIEAVIECPRPVRVGCLYLPNGNPVGTEKFAYKLAWMDRLQAHARDLLRLEEAFTLCGDYNVIPTPDDAKNPAAWATDALFQPESRAAFRALNNLGLSEAGALGKQPPGTFTFWDYQAGAWQRDHGIRIDFHLLSPQAADRFVGVETHRDARDMDKPSDHVPVVVELED